MTSGDAPSAEGIDREWWKEATVYQIYPRSFNDTDGDGVGDLQGVVEKVPYLDDLGADVVWLCPVYDSPQADNGYDIRDYRTIDETFGTMADWEALRDALHDRDMKLVMDLVVNHTSDEHEWFEKSRRREPGYEDFYYWRDEPADGGLPNNWESFFGGPTWTFDEVREQYYLHLFDTKQPDLNWRNPEVREAIYEMMRWWLEKGVDGFRMDVVNLLSKTEGLPDGEENGQVGTEHFVDGPRIHEYLREMNDEVLSDYDVMTVGETPGTDVEQAREYIEDGLGSVFHFQHMLVDVDGDSRWDVADDEALGEWDLRDLKRVLTRWQEGMEDGGWNSVYLNNHDQTRPVSRFGNDGAYRVESAKLFATLLLTLRGTPYLFQGDEIGMTNVDFETFEEIRDVDAKNHAELLMEERGTDDYQDVRHIVNHRSRDNSRTPMQWDDSDHAGFTDGEPWIKVAENYREINAADAGADPDSVWHYYRDLIDLRHGRDVLVYGEYDLLCPDDGSIYAYTRTLGDESMLVVLNVDEDHQSVALGEVADDATLVRSNYGGGAADLSDLQLRPYEARVYDLH
ncbi:MULTISPECIES: glycoside hydrolase family 13 protein [Haloarcula]|uniref:glycoside hydrolase family 13 protein n=1 Tax=Haloarcula TaxID=2237 RepID=UPI0023ECE55D|nr:alpha-glucosidase [Halomicroarcula sp. XH51]